MAYLIKLLTVNEDTGSVSAYFHENIYETKKLAEFVAFHTEFGVHYDGVEVVKSDNNVYVKTDKTANDYSSQVYYGCPEHQMFGDAWLYADCEGAW